MNFMFHIMVDTAGVVLRVHYKSRILFRISTVRYNGPTSVHASQAFSIAHCTDSEDLPKSMKCDVSDFAR